VGIFLDELSEFGQRVLEVLRQPIEDQIVTISWTSGLLRILVNFQWIVG